MDIMSIIISIASALYLVLGFFVYLRNRRSSVNFWFLFLVLPIFLEGMTMIGYRESSTLSGSVFWAKWLYIFASFIPSIFIFFTYTFSKNAKKLSPLCKMGIIVLNFIILSLILGSSSIIETVFIPTEGEKFISFGDLYFLYVLSVLLLFSISYLQLFLFSRRAFGLFRNQAKFVFIGTFLSGIIHIITNIILPSIGIFSFYWLGQASFVIMMCFISYAIVRYRLMDVRLIIVRSIAFGIIFLLAGIVFSITTVLFSNLFAHLAGLRANILTAVVLSVLVAAFYGPFRKSIERITNNFFYKQSYQPQAVIKTLAEATSSIANREELLASISQILLETFHCKKIAVVLIGRDGKQLTPALQNGFEKNVFEMLISFLKVIHPASRRFELTPGIQVIDELKARYENGDMDLADPKLLYALYENDVAIVAPLYVKDLLIGVLVLDNKQSGDPYSNEDLQVLNIISHQTAVAVENSTLYGEQKNFTAKLKEEVSKATKQLRDANRRLKELLKLKSEFLTIASHQLRTPTSIVKGMLSMVVEGSVTGEQRENFIQKSFIGINRLEGIIHDLLNASELEGEKMKLACQGIDIEEVIGHILSEREKMAKDKGLTLEYKKPKNKPPLVLADRVKLVEALANLVDNAILYTEKGEIHISVSVNPAKRMLEVRIRDTGIGVSKKDMKRLFLKFSRGEKSMLVNPNGSGLGLFIVKKIAEGCGGSVRVESEGIGKGSIFIFTLMTSPKSAEKNV